MKLRSGTLIPNTETPVGEGVNAAVRAVVRVDDVSQLAIVKRIPLQAVLAECFCGLLFRGWGLPTPEPIIIRDNSEILFASIDAGYPNLKKRLGWDDQLPESQQQALVNLCAQIVCSWTDTPRALAADEAIANADRNLGNFLWDGSEHAYIDHERTLGLYPQHRNIIAELAKLANKAEEIERAAVAAALVLDGAAPNQIVPPDDVDLCACVNFVERQLQGLAGRVLARFPKPTDLLSGLQAS